MTFDVKDLIEKGIEKGTDNKKMLMILAKATKHKWDNLTTFMLLYKEIFGNTLCKEYCEWMIDNMHNDSEYGRKWSVEETNELARKNSINFGNDYTEDEFNCVVHMMYYDFGADIKESGISSDNIYAKMADSYLTDVDAPKGKLVNYFFSIARDIEE